MRIWTFLVLALLIASPSWAQLSQPHLPPTYPGEVNPQPAPVVTLEAPLLDDLVEAQQKSLKTQSLYPTGKVVPVSIDPLQSGQWTLLPNGDRVCRTWIRMKGAQALTLYFEELFLPIGCELYSYNDTKRDHFGPFTFMDNAEEEWIGSGSVRGDKIGLELFIPAGTSLDPNVRIGQIGYQYDPRKGTGVRGFGDSEDCQINVECDEGNDWGDQIRSVVRIKLRYAGFEGWCTGTLMNNSFQNCTPYILTADHCRRLQDGTEANETEYADFEFYFKYQSDRCRDPNNEGDVGFGKLTGSSFRSGSGGGGTGGPDFMLLELTDQVPQFFDPFYAGWDNRNIPSNSGVMLHHPAGDIKKVATYIHKAESSEWEGNFKDTHWKIFWAETQNGHSVSEPGSSGSALFNQDGRVVGQLTGGASACKEATGVSPFFPDYFGKMSYNWLFRNNDSTMNVYSWLDEGKSQVSFMGGINWPCSEQPLSRQPSVQEKESWKVFPNPVENGRLKFEWNLENSVEEVEVKLLDLSGREILKSTIEVSNPILDVVELSPGFYLVQIPSLSTTYQKIQVR